MCPETFCIGLHTEKQHNFEENLHAFLESEGANQAPEEVASKQKGFDSNTMGLRFPIWLCACSYKQFTHKLINSGTKEKKSDFVRWVDMGFPAPPKKETPASDSSNLPTNSQTAKKAKQPVITAAVSHPPNFQFLAASLVKYLQNFHYEDLDLPVSALYCVLLCPAVS